MSSEIEIQPFANQDMKLFEDKMPLEFKLSAFKKANTLSDFLEDDFI